MSKKTTSKLYSERAVAWGTFFGGPLAGAYFISENYKTLGKRDLAKKSLIIGVVITVLFLAYFVVFPSNIFDKLPKSTLAIVFPILAAFHVRQSQGKELAKAKEKKENFYRWTRTFVLSLVALALTLVIGIVLVYTLPIYPPACLVDEANRGQKLHDVEEATCYVYKNQQGSELTWGEINSVLYSEVSYQEAYGLVNTETGEVTTYTDYDPVPFIKRRVNESITTEEIQQILKIEEGYYQFIGAVK